MWNRMRRKAAGLTHAVPRFLYPAGTPQVFIQHDADRLPERTLYAMCQEKVRGIRSASYFFRERCERWRGDDEGYDLPLEEMATLEKQGFEIGYHLNAPERANYCAELTWRYITEDVEYFSRRFDLKSFVPHGGQPGPGGLNNHNIEQKRPLDSLIWFYNGRGFSCDVSWSDGGIASPDTEKLPDPRELAKQIKGRMRARFLFHPQYYGDEPCAEAYSAGVAKTGWWKSLWQST